MAGNPNHDSKGKFASSGSISRVDAAEKMHGTGSKQHLAAVKKYGPKGGPQTQVINPK